MKIGIYSPYLDILGGGERYVLTVVEYFLQKSDAVTIFWDKELNFKKISERFSLDITRAQVLPRKRIKTHEFDIIFWVSDGSIPLSFAKKNILHFQQPFRFARRSPVNKLKLLKINAIVCNSKFTKKFIDESYGVNSTVLYPPVDIGVFKPGSKEKIILSVGRFFSPYHPKNQHVLIEAFKKLSPSFPNWRLVLIGGIAPEHRQHLATLEEAAKGLKVTIITDVTIKTLKDHYAKAALYWHATGFGHDLDTDPGKAEHFGITTVEAMSAGCVPIVYKGGGQLEIIADGDDGFFWSSVAELIEKTENVIESPKLTDRISQNAIQRSKDFSKQQFFSKLDNLLQ